jgi:tetratricopeptide (TPR) repeat protein
LDQQSEAVARGYFNLGNVTYQQNGELVKAEKLVRESLRIETRLYDDDHANRVQAQGKLSSETKELHERCLAIDIKNFGPEGINTAASNGNLGEFYHRQAEASRSAGTRKEHLLLSLSKFKEVLQIFTKILGHDNPRTIENSSQLSIVSHKLSEGEKQLI